MSYKARKKNRVITIPEEKAEEYASMGYEVSNADGEIVADAVISSIEDARHIIAMLGKEKEELEAKLEVTTKKVEELQKTITDMKSNEKSIASGSANQTKEQTAKSSKKSE